MIFAHSWCDFSHHKTFGTSTCTKVHVNILDYYSICTTYTWSYQYNTFNANRLLISNAHWQHCT